MALNDYNVLENDPVITAANDLLGLNILPDTLFLLKEMVEMDIAQIIGYTLPGDDHSLDNVKVDMLIFRYGRRGAENLKSYSGAGVSETYLTDYPEYIFKHLRGKRRLKLL